MRVKHSAKPVRGIGEDLQHVQLYLERKFQDQAPIRIGLQRHYGSEPEEIAYLIVFIDDREDRRRVRAVGEAALCHIGYRFAPRPGDDVFDARPWAGDLSSHEVIRALRRFDGLT
jgi:hypothetical protein